MRKKALVNQAGSGVASFWAEFEFWLEFQLLISISKATGLLSDFDKRIDNWYQNFRY